jgi:hypothetical protein
MKRAYTVKIDGKEYYTEGSFSYGAFNAFKDILDKRYSSFDPIPGGSIVAYIAGGPQWCFEGIDHDAQMGLRAWVTETNY